MFQLAETADQMRRELNEKSTGGGDWAGDVFCGMSSTAGALVEADDLNGWLWAKDYPLPKDRPVWVITEHLRRCIVQGGIFIRWALVDERCLFWHPAEVTNIQAPPDFPVGLELSKDGKRVCWPQES